MDKAKETIETIVDLNECLKDSPFFREAIEKADRDIEHFEKTLFEVRKHSLNMIEIGRQFINAKNLFISSLVNLKQCFESDKEVSKPMNHFITTFYETSKYQTTLNEHFARAVNEQLSAFLTDDIGAIKDLKRRFEKRSDDLDLVHMRYSQVPKSKQAEWEEAKNLLEATRPCFQYVSLDYVTHISIFNSRRRHVVLDLLLSLANSYGTYFHQGYDHFDTIKNENESIGNSLSEMRTKTLKLDKYLKDHQQRMLAQSDPVPSIQRHGNSIALEGYLYKRTSSTFKTWNRRWFIIQNHQLVYQRRSHEREVTVMEEDLRLCRAKPVTDIDRRFCFEVVSPTKSHILQADSEESCNRWIDALQQGIDAAYHSNREDAHHQHAAPLHGKRGSNSNYLDRSSSDSLSTSTTGSFTTSTTGVTSSATANYKESMGNNINGSGNNNNPLANFFSTHSQAGSANSDCARILKVSGNNKCADCGSPEPIWASLNLGITLCIECSGVHRSLGVHLSKVRSLNLDRLECEQVNVMLELGNDVINQIYEAKWPIYEATASSSSDGKATPEDNKQSNDNDNARDQSPNPSLQLADTSIDSSKSNSSFYIESGEKDSLLTISETSPQQQQQQQGSAATTPTHTNTASSRPVKIHPKSSRPERTAWIRAKYVDKLFVDKSVKLQITPSEETKKAEDSVAEVVAEQEEGQNKSVDTTDSVEEILWKVMSQLSSPGYFDKLEDSDDIIDHYYNLMLYEAAGVRNLPLMARALAGDAAVNWHNRLDRGRTPLYKAVMSNTMTACEYLLLNGAKCNEPDDDGCIALHYATRMGNTGQVCLLLKRGSDVSALNSNNENALAIAMDKEIADIVTLLRLKKLKDEMRNDDVGGQHDDTFNEVIRDFSLTQIRTETTSSNQCDGT